MFFKSIAALVTAGATLFAAPASAEIQQIGNYGPFAVMADDTTKLCGLGITGPEGDVLTIAYDAKNNMTAFQYSNPKYANLSGHTVTIDLYVDSDRFQWNGRGEGQGVFVTSTDPNVPNVLINSEVFGMGVGNQMMFSVGSDDNFEAAMADVVMCSILLNQ